MKIKGQEIKGPNEDILVIPRQTSENSQQDLVFKARAVLDYSEFDALVPVPLAPQILRRGDTVATSDLTDPEFRKALAEYSSKRTHWMILKSLEATEGLEWSTIKMSEPDTWQNLSKELESAGLNTAEANRLINMAGAVNGLDEEKFEQARQRFLLSRADRG